MILPCHRIVFVFAAVACIGTGTIATGYAQQSTLPQAPPIVAPPAPPASTPNAVAAPTVVYPPYVADSPVNPQFGMAVGRGRSAQGPLQKALANVQSQKQQYNAAQSEEARNIAKESLRTAISEFFDAELKLRRERIDGLTNRISTLSGLLEKRTSAKQDIINLQLKAYLLDDAESAAGDSTPAGTSFPAYAPYVQSPSSQESGLPAAVKRLRSAITAENADEVKSATDAVHKALEEVFDKDLQARTKELDGVRALVANLTKAVDKRTSRKQEIIDVQFQLALLDADGLGIPGDGWGNPFSNSVAFPGAAAPAAVFQSGFGSTVSAGAAPSIGQNTSYRLGAAAGTVPPAGAAASVAPTQGVALGSAFITVDRAASEIQSRDTRTNKVLWKTSLNNKAGKLSDRLDFGDGKITVYDEKGTAYQLNVETGAVQNPPGK